jgi:hypothetical protein
MKKFDRRKKTDETEEKPKARAFNIAIKLSEKKGQAQLEKFKLKAKTGPTEDVNHFLNEKAKELLSVLADEYEGVTGKEKFGDILDVSVGQPERSVRSRKALTMEALKEEVTKLSIPDWRVEITEARVCVSCGGALELQSGYCNENGEGYVCESCMEYDRSEHVTTVRFSDRDDPLDVCTIGMYHNDTEGEFKVVWHRTDAWRGYSSIVPSKHWKELHSDAILSMSEDEQNLADFDKALRAQLNKMGIRWARVISPTSNIFCCGYDFYVEAKHFKKAEALARQLAKTWRDPAEFAITALTGKSPRDCTPTDRAFAAIGTAMLASQKEEAGQ